MPEGPVYVIIGASLAGAKAAETLRDEGFGGPIVLLGTEAEQPYERPPLSKGYLLGKADKASLYVHDEHWYAGHQVDLRLGVTAVAVDRAARRVDLDIGGPVGYDRLLLTTGSHPRVLQVPGGDLDGVHYLRTTAQSEALATANILRARRRLDGVHYLRTGRIRGAGHRLAPIPGEETRVVIVGGGWIGLEVAAAAREKGCAVTVLEAETTPLYRQVGPELGQLFADLHREHGVVFRFGDSAREFRGEEGRVTTVLTSEGAELPADVVVVAIGAAPNVALAEAAGLEVGRRRARGRRRWRPATRTSSRPVIWPTWPTRCWAARSGSSTGPTRCTAARPRPGPCWASRCPTTGCRTSSATSTTWAWRRPGCPSPGTTTRSCTGVTRRRWSSSRSGCPAGRWWPA